MNRLILIIASLTLLFSGCSKSFLESELRSSKRYEDNTKTPDDLHNLVLGLMNNLNNNNMYGKDFIVYGEVISDNVYNNGAQGSYLDVANFSLSKNGSTAAGIWGTLYNVIVRCNDIINNRTVEENSEVLSYKGQAKVIRALCYFELDRYFSQRHTRDGEGLSVPIVLNFPQTDLEKVKPARSSLEDVKSQIYSDILDAIAELSFGDFPKTEITQDAAIALYSRFALYFGDYEDAMKQAEKVINTNKYEIVSKEQYDNIWKEKGGAESIMELAYTSTDYPGTGSYPFLYSSQGYNELEFVGNLMDQYEEGDVRYPYIDIEAKSLKKFPNKNQEDTNIKFVRYGEVILNYVEASVRLNKDTEYSYILLNYLLERRGAKQMTSEAEFTLSRVLKERRLELAGEGFRYFDLLRCGKQINTYDNKGEVTHQLSYPSNKLAFPIPLVEMDMNSNINEQNPGY